MSVLEEVKKMYEQGMQENQIVEALQEQGISYKEISEALSQSKIKAAVEQPVEENQIQQDPEVQYQEENNDEQFQNPDAQNSQFPGQQEVSGMQKSIMQTSPKTQEISEYLPNQTEQYENQYPNQSNYTENYGEYGYAPASISPDTITEISEQVVSEKLGEIRKKIDKVIDFKTTIESKTDSIEERLKRIEKTIDILQSSVLRKVGDYVTNIEDIKKELIATQQSFSKALPDLKAHQKPKKTTTKK
ncbi:MAG: hypothetical protein Q8P57_01315 [Candidatus Pacearchaeota archaeon]|nr:hypothetical protein [Candidatus Pacearchaeota archaeon]